MDARHYDWIIIGFGGSVSALRLAEKDYRVLVIEKGKRFAADDFPNEQVRFRDHLQVAIDKLRTHCNDVSEHVGNVVFMKIPTSIRIDEARKLSEEILAAEGHAACADIGPDVVWEMQKNREPDFRGFARRAFR